MGTTVGSRAGAVSWRVGPMSERSGNPFLVWRTEGQAISGWETVQLRAYRGFVTGSEAAPWKSSLTHPLRLQRVLGGLASALQLLSPERHLPGLASPAGGGGGEAGTRVQHSAQQAPPW